MNTPADRSATKALLKEELKIIGRQLRLTQRLADAGELEQAVEAAGVVADRAWGVAQILHAEELLHRFGKT